MSDAILQRKLTELFVFTEIRDFSTLFYGILRPKYPEWLESSIENYLGMLFAMLTLDDLVVRDFAFFKHLFFSVRTGH